MRRLFAGAGEAERRGIPVEEVLGEADAERRIGRRAFIAKGAVAGAALAVGSQLLRPQRGEAAVGPRIAIVGSGLAGLRCAHRLWHAEGGPLASTVYEASTDHIGGRCWSLRSYFSDGLIGEHGGAFINSDQATIRTLVADLGLELEAVGGGDLPQGDQIVLVRRRPLHRGGGDGGLAGDRPRRVPARRARRALPPAVARLHDRRGGVWTASASRHGWTRWVSGPRRGSGACSWPTACRSTGAIRRISPA